MTLRSVLVVLSLFLSLLIGIVVSRSTDGTAKDRTTRERPLIGFSMDTLKEERWQTDRDLFTAQVEQLGGEVVVQSANSDDSRQLTDVQSLITQGVDALVIIPHNGAAMAKAVDLAHQAGIPVLSYDRLITGTDLDLYITFDNEKVGELQAQFIADRVPADRPMRLVRIYGSKTDNNALLFKKGQDRVLQPLIESGRIEVVFEDWAADWRPENAKKIMNAAITQAGSELDAVLASNDGTAGGAIQALIEEGLSGQMVITGQDADLAACQRIAQGSQTMTVYKPIATLAEQAAVAAMKLARGRPLIAGAGIDNGRIEVPSILLDIVAVTKDNLRETVIADGFRKEGDVFGE